MPDNDDSFQPESLEEHLDQLLHDVSRSEEAPTPEARLVQDLRCIYVDDTLSGQRVWARLVEQHATPRSLHIVSRPDTLEKKVQPMQTSDLNTMQSQPTTSRRKRRSLIALIAAMATLIVIVVNLSIASFILRQGSAPRPGTAAAPTSTSLSLQVNPLCSFADNNPTRVAVTSPVLDWSTNNQLAVVYANLRTIDGTTCAQHLQSNSPIVEAFWSPDHTRLLTDEAGAHQVLNAQTGKVVATFHSSEMPAPFSSMWSSDGTQIISMIQVSGSTIILQAWSPVTGQPVGPVLLTLNTDDASFILPSPDGKFMLTAGEKNINIWDMGKRKLVSTLPVNIFGDDEAIGVTWSPDDSKIAIGGLKSKVVTIWSVLDGKSVGSFTDHAGSLYWSPDGKYIAEATTQIYLWDMSTKQVAASFGLVGAKQFVDAVVWSPDSKKLASSTVSTKDFTQHTVNIWQLS